MIGLFNRPSAAIRGANDAREFLATSPTPEAVRAAWGAASFKNDEYDRAWKRVVREAGAI